MEDDRSAKIQEPNHKVMKQRVIGVFFGFPQSSLHWNVQEVTHGYEHINLNTRMSLKGLELMFQKLFLSVLLQNVH